MALQATYPLFFINHICLQCTPRAQETSQGDVSQVRSKYQHERAQIEDRQTLGIRERRDKKKRLCSWFKVYSRGRKIGPSLLSAFGATPATRSLHLPVIKLKGILL